MCPSIFALCMRRFGRDAALACLRIDACHCKCLSVQVVASSLADMSTCACSASY